jgi:hypothetical protein
LLILFGLFLSEGDDGIRFRRFYEILEGTYLLLLEG